MESDYQPTPVETGIGGAPPTAKSIWSIIGNVFMAPTQAFADYVVKPTILIPIILTVILGGTIGWVNGPYGAKLQYEILKQSTTMPASALADMKEQAENPEPIGGAIGGGIVPVVFGALAALVVLFLGRFVFGGEGGFMAAWGVGILAGLIPMLGGLLRIPLMMAKDSILVSYGLAALMPGKDFTSITFALVYFLDIWAVWSIIVGGIGYAAVFGLSRNKGIAISTMTTLLFVFLYTALQMFGMSMAGVEISWF